MQFDHSFDVITPDQGVGITLGGNRGAILPTGTTIQRPSHLIGLVRFNADTARFEYSNGTSWNPVPVIPIVDDTPPSSPQLGDWWIQPSTGVASVRVPSSGGDTWFVPVGQAGADGANGSGALFFMNTAPTSSVPGDRWINSDTGVMYTRVQDADSTQWVEMGSNVGPRGLTGPQGPAGVTDPGMVVFFAMSTPPTGWLKANGAAVVVADYPALATAIYCGDANNPTALFGYRCTNPATPSTTRATGGAYIVIPDLRGEFIRAWDDGRGIDSSRAFGTFQSSQNISHTHVATGSSTAHTHSLSDPGHAHSVADPGHTHGAYTDAQGYHDHASGSRASGAEAGGYGLTLSAGFQDRPMISGGHSGYRTDGAGSHGHNITVNGAYTGIGIYGAGTGITLGSTAASVSVTINADGGTEARPRNISLLACIRY